MKNGRGLKLLLALLIVALAAVLAVIVWRQHEYGVSEQYYDTLRGLMRSGRWTA